TSLAAPVGARPPDRRRPHPRVGDRASRRRRPSAGRGGRAMRRLLGASVRVLYRSGPVPEASPPPGLSPAPVGLARAPRRPRLPLRLPMTVAPLAGKARRSVALATARTNVWEGSVRSG